MEGRNGACFRLPGRVYNLGKDGTGEVKPGWESGSKVKGISLTVGFSPAYLPNECIGANGFREATNGIRKRSDEERRICRGTWT